MDDDNELRRNQWPLALVIIAIVIGLTVMCTVGPAPEWLQ